MSESDGHIIGTTASGVNVTTDDVDDIVKDVFDELKAGRATVQSRPRNYYEVIIPFDRLPEELKQAIC